MIVWKNNISFYFYDVLELKLFTQKTYLYNTIKQNSTLVSEFHIFGENFTTYFGSQLINPTSKNVKNIYARVVFLFRPILQNSGHSRARSLICMRPAWCAHQYSNLPRRWLNCYSNIPRRWLNCYNVHAWRIIPHDKIVPN